MGQWTNEVQYGKYKDGFVKPMEENCKLKDI